MNLSIDISTIASSACLAGIIWLIKTVSQQQTRQAVADEHDKQQAAAMTELRARVAVCEAEVQSIKLAVAKITAITE